MDGETPASDYLVPKRLGIDTYQEMFAFVHAKSSICGSEGFEAHTRVRVTTDGRSVIATLNIVTGDLLEPNELGLSESAWHRLLPPQDAHVRLEHVEPLLSLSAVRSKVYGNELSADELREIIGDIARGRYSDVHLACFVTACAGDGLNTDETIALTRAMVDVGDRITWDADIVVDKHCVGGLPGNRTTLILVPIVAAHGLIIPKTSSRAITSPAGSADVMETLAPIDLGLGEMRKVVEETGGCIVEGGSIRLSPADEMIIRVERPLDLDSEAQLIASVLSKKVAAGSTHVVIDIPVGPTAKIRSVAAADRLEAKLRDVAGATGLTVDVVATDGSEPIGNGIGPALEARDVLKVLQNSPDAPNDLRRKAIHLAGHVLELTPGVKSGEGAGIAREIVADGRAWQKFQQICEAQGGMRELPRAPYQRAVAAKATGRIADIDNRRLAQVAKLAGAPRDPAAGLVMPHHVGETVQKGAPLFTVHAESPGELDYALEFARTHEDIITLEEK